MKAGKTGKAGKAGKAGKQRGGADWYIIPASRKADWDTYLNAHTDLKTKLDFITADSRNTEQHLTILERQDDLFAIARGIIVSKLDLSDNYTSQNVVDKVTDINAKRAEMMEYITDVENLVNFTITTDETNKTKLDQIRGDADETLSTLLIFPDRLKNVFIQSLASILIVLKQDDTVLKQSTDDTIDITNAQYMSHVYGSAYVQTAFKPRDGFFIAESAQDFAKELEGPDGRVPFFKELITEIKKINEAISTGLANKGEKQDEQVFMNSIFRVREDGCLKNIESASWATITAHVFQAYKHGLHDNILMFFANECSRSQTLVDDGPRDFIPNKYIDEEEVRGTTYKNIRSWMGDETLQYILHLCYTIKQNEAAVLAAMGASASSVSSAASSATTTTTTTPPAVSSSAPPPTTTTTTTAPPTTTTTTTTPPTSSRSASASAAPANSSASTAPASATPAPANSSASSSNSSAASSRSASPAASSRSASPAAPAKSSLLSGLRSGFTSLFTLTPAQKQAKQEEEARKTQEDAEKEALRKELIDMLIKNEGSTPGINKDQQSFISIFLKTRNPSLKQLKALKEYANKNKTLVTKLKKGEQLTNLEQMSMVSFLASI